MRPRTPLKCHLISAAWACLVFIATVLPSSAADLETRNLVARGNIEYRQLRFDKALTRYDEAIQRDAKYALAHNNRGLALHKLGRPEDAAAALERAVELDGSEAAFHLNLGKVYATNGRYEDALQSSDRALQRDPGMPAAVYNRVWVLDQQGQIAKATEECGRLTALREQPPGSKMLVGIVEARQGQAASLAEATCTPADLPQLWRWLTEANRSLGTEGAADMPAGAQDALCRGVLAASTERFDAALKHFSVARAAAPNHPLPPWLSAMVLMTSGDQQGAEAMMRRAAPLMPTFSIPASGDPTVLFLNGTLIGRAPVTTSLLPGVHLVDVVRGSREGYAIFNECGVFRPGVAYNLPAVKFNSMPPPSQLALPADLRAAIQGQ